MARRNDTGDFLSVHARPGLSPSASPVDTYVRPQAEETRGQALSRALKGLDQSMNPVLNRSLKKAAERESAEGQEAFARNRRDFAEAVRNGEIPMGASPFFRKAYRASQLHVTGATYNVELKRALEHSNLHEMSDPAEVEEFIQAFDAEFSETNGIERMPAVELAEHYRPIVVAANDSFRNDQARRNIEYVEEMRFRTFQAEVAAAVSMGEFSGPPGSASASASNLRDWLQARATEMYEQGIDYEMIEETIGEAVAGAAVSSGSHAALGVLNQITVTGLPISQTERGRKRVSGARNAIARAEEARARAAQAEVNARRVGDKKALRSQMQAAAASGDYERARELFHDLNRVDPAGASAAYGLLKRFEGEAEDETEAGNYATLRQVVQGATSEAEAIAIIEEAETFGGVSPEDASRLRGYAERKHQPGPVADPINTVEADSSFKSMSQHISRSIIGDGMSYGGEDQDRAARAVEEFTDAGALWVQQNADADGNYDPLALRSYLRTERDQILRDTTEIERYQPPKPAEPEPEPVPEEDDGWLPAWVTRPFDTPETDEVPDYMK